MQPRKLTTQSQDSSKLTKGKGSIGCLTTWLLGGVVAIGAGLLCYSQRHGNILGSEMLKAALWLFAMGGISVLVPGGIKLVLWGSSRNR